MTTKNAICKKIEEIIPEAGKCNTDYSVQYDKKNHAWSVDMSDGEHHLKTFIERGDAQQCLKGDKCIPLGLQIGQLKRNLYLFKKL